MENDQENPCLSVVAIIQLYFQGEKKDWNHALHVTLLSSRKSLPHFRVIIFSVQQILLPRNF